MAWDRQGAPQPALEAPSVRGGLRSRLTPLLPEVPGAGTSLSRDGTAAPGGAPPRSLPRWPHSCRRSAAAPMERDVADRKAALVDGLAQAQETGQRPLLVPQRQVTVQAEPVAPHPVEPLAPTHLPAAAAEDGQHAHRFAIGAALLLRC